jgi:hypothetical protein
MRNPVAILIIMVLIIAVPLIISWCFSRGPCKSAPTPTPSPTLCLITVVIELAGTNASAEATLQVGERVYQATIIEAGKLAFHVPCEYANQPAKLVVEAGGYTPFVKSIGVTEDPLSESITLEPLPTFTPTPSPTPTYTHTPTSTPTSTPKPTDTHTPTSTPTSTPAPTDTHTPTSTPTSTPTPTDTHTPTPTPTPTLTPVCLMVADFETGDSINNLGGEMGSASDDPDDHLWETYIDTRRGGKAARLKYSIEDWSAFWLKLPMFDLTPYRQLKFDIRADAPSPYSIKIELHRVCTTEYDVTICTEGDVITCTEVDVTTCTEVEYTRVYEISEEWKQQPVTVDLSDFKPTGWKDYSELSSWQDMEELVFVFELRFSGRSGVVYLDNIEFCE